MEAAAGIVLVLIIVLIIYVALAIKIVQQYEQGLVERFGPLPPARAIHLLRQACQSLERVYVHVDQAEEFAAELVRQAREYFTDHPHPTE